jgi:hypothetical protein
MESTAKLSRRWQTPAGAGTFMMAVLVATIGLAGVRAPAAASEQAADPAAAAVAPADAPRDAQAGTGDAKADEAKAEETEAAHAKPRVSPYAAYRKRHADAEKAAKSSSKTPKKPASGKPAGQVNHPQ